MYDNIILKTVDYAKNHNLKQEQILRYLFKNKQLKEDFVNEIRRTTIVGHIANEVFNKLGFKKQCKLLTIGDVVYYGEIKKEWDNMIKSSLQNILSDKIVGYDLTGQSSFELRKSIYDYMNVFYNFENIDFDLISNIMPTYGATDGFASICDGFTKLFPNKKIRFCYPEASFMANVQIAESFNMELYPIHKPTKDNFFIDPYKISSHIFKKDDYINIYYITVVGNPTGSMLSPQQLYSVIHKIYLQDSQSYFIFDNVYAGLLNLQDCKLLFKEIFANKSLLSKIVFCESLSKTLGTTGIRIGWLRTSNIQLFQTLKTNVILQKAGFSKILSEFAINIVSQLDRVIKFQDKASKYWTKQRLKFIAYFKENFLDMIDWHGSVKVPGREGIYVLLKLKEGIDFEQVYATTLMLGVGITLSDGKYIRYCFANIDFSF